MVTKKVQRSWNKVFGVSIPRKYAKLRNLTYYAVVLILGRVTESELSDRKTLLTLFFLIIIEDSFYSNYKELIKKKLIKKF